MVDICADSDGSTDELKNGTLPSMLRAKCVPCGDPDGGERRCFLTEMGINTPHIANEYAVPNLSVPCAVALRLLRLISMSCD